MVYAQPVQTVQYQEEINHKYANDYRSTEMVANIQQKCKNMQIINASNFDIEEKNKLVSELFTDREPERAPAQQPAKDFIIEEAQHIYNGSSVHSS